ncbi:aminotransferase class I/II-fold pyridoxal phosphate-dependent enzyme [Specibacter cremeus]|uniref:aminotransferase class I/II-fold pyridoxal phosphate-dependent enzyme n=1 Tax=Specibacter cremeus TaxID=1629051 RepID=UPI000F793D46|nr:aminotransferase class I/II-fold pyridoxal phosphate-dependent enzyme [Specibacter cremeus]
MNSGSRPEPRKVIAALPQYSSAAGTSRVTWRASSNESVLPPSPRVVEAIARAGATAHLYPSLLGDALVADIAERLQVTARQVVVGGGSLALLQQTLSTYTGHGTEVIFGWRSYEAYPILVGVAGSDAVPVPLGADGTHDLAAMLAAVTPSTKAIILCNPNNPTGTEVGREQVELFLQRVPPTVLVLLDEAYQEFATTSLDGVGLLDAYPNLAVFRTFSKAYGLAGLRAGYMVTSEEIADFVRVASPPFGLSTVAEAAAQEAGADADYSARVLRLVAEGRDRLRAGLAERGFPTPVSGGNFVWIPLPHGARELEVGCIARGVSVRAFDGEGVRATVGERAAEDAVLAAVDDLMATVASSPGKTLT